jgi:hypothetical protein
MSLEKVKQFSRASQTSKYHLHTSFNWVVGLNQHRKKYIYTLIIVSINILHIT